MKRYRIGGAVIHQFLGGRREEGRVLCQIHMLRITVITQTYKYMLAGLIVERNCR